MTKAFQPKARPIAKAIFELYGEFLPSHLCPWECQLTGLPFGTGYVLHPRYERPE